MAEDCGDLLDRARTTPKSLSFADIRKLAECNGYTLDRVRGSHHIFVREGARLLNLQPRHGDSKMAKPYQVRDLVALIDSLKEK